MKPRGKTPFRTERIKRVLAHSPWVHEETWTDVAHPFGPEDPICTVLQLIRDTDESAVWSTYEVEEAVDELLLTTDCEHAPPGQRFIAMMCVLEALAQDLEQSTGLVFVDANLLEHTVPVLDRLDPQAARAAAEIIQHAADLRPDCLDSERPMSLLVEVVLVCLRRVSGELKVVPPDLVAAWRAGCLDPDPVAFPSVSARQKFLAIGSASQTFSKSGFS